MAPGVVGETPALDLEFDHVPQLSKTESGVEGATAAPDLEHGSIPASADNHDPEQGTQVAGDVMEQRSPEEAKAVPPLPCARASQDIGRVNVQTGITAETVLDLVHSNNKHGKCNVIFVGIKPSGAQKSQLQAYSRLFKVRIVYLDTADTILDVEVQARLGMQSLYDSRTWYPDWTVTGPPRIKLAAGAVADSRLSVVQHRMTTNPKLNNLWQRPVEQISALPTGVRILANYAAEDDITILRGTTSRGNSVAIAEYTAADGLEEMHAFLTIAWFDTGSWGWAHFIAEWGTRGIFQDARTHHDKTASILSSGEKGASSGIRGNLL